MKRKRTGPRTKISEGRTPAYAGAVTLAQDDCPSCGAVMQRRKGTLRYPVNGEEIAVPGMVHMRCPKCGEVLLRQDGARHLREQAQDMYRTRHRLLTPTQIRAVRERFNLTQVEMARVLRLGGNTLSRWESGRNVQTAAMDVLLRMIRDVAGSLEYLQRFSA